MLVVILKLHGASASSIGLANRKKMQDGRKRCIKDRKNMKRKDTHRFMHESKTEKTYRKKKNANPERNNSSDIDNYNKYLPVFTTLPIE